MLMSQLTSKLVTKRKNQAFNSASPIQTVPYITKGVDEGNFSPYRSIPANKWRRKFITKMPFCNC